MVRWNGIVACTIVLAAAACGGTTPGSGAAGDRLDERQRAFVNAMAARDAGAMAALFADDAVVHVAGMPPLSGSDAIRSFYANMFEFLAESRVEPDATHIADAGDMAYSMGSTRNAFRTPTGTAQFAGKYALVWRSDAGEWVIALYSVSSNQQDGGR